MVEQVARLWFIVKYRKGQENRVANALSCKEEEVSLVLILVPSIELLKKNQAKVCQGPKAARLNV